MECPKCQFENQDGSKFCGSCGSSIVVKISCVQCGFENPNNCNFCNKCGCDLRGSQETSPEVKPKSAQSSEKFESVLFQKKSGERKHVTVLFSDMTGYTSMSERLDPEEVKEITSKVFEKTAKIITKYDGFVEKYIGDAVVAIFGATKSFEDDPVRAIKATMEIHAAVEKLAPEYEDKIGHKISMHSGINTGLVVTGDIDIEKGTHGIAGDTINLAARLSSLGNEGDILVGQSTYIQSEGFFNFKAIDPVKVKGKAENVLLHKVLSLKKHPKKVHRLQGARANLIGRKVEMGKLNDGIRRLLKNEGMTISICGTAGTGKSRLVEEFRMSLDLNKIQWLEGHAYSYAQNIPYSPLINMLNHTFKIDEGDSSEKVRKKLESGLSLLVGSQKDVIPYIGSLYSLSYPEVDEVSPEYWQVNLQKAVRIIFLAFAKERPTVICLEDLHWGDPSFLELIHQIISDFEGAILFLCIYRPTITLFSNQQIETMMTNYHEIRLQDLSLSESQDMVEALLKTEKIPLELQKFIQSKVEGNPFYIEELINSLIESKTLVSKNAEWVIIKKISGSDISSTIHGVISARLDRLEIESKQILREASVIGRTFFYKIINKISDVKFNVDSYLSGLEHLDLIKIKSIQPDIEYIFKHALTQEIVYGGLLKKERKDIHDRIGLVMEQIFQDRLPEFYETMAFHFSQGQSQFKAIFYLIKSGDKSLKRYALEESNQYFKQAYDILGTISEKNQEELGMLIDIINKWASVFYFLGDVSGFMELLKAHEKDAERLDDEARQGMYYAWFGWAKGMQEQVNESFKYLYKALEIGERTNDPLVMGYACTWLVFSCMEGLLGKGAAFGKKAFGIAKDIESDQYLYFKSLSGMGHIYYQQGKRKRISKIAKRLLDYGTRHSNVRCVTVGHICSGYDHEIVGNFPSAIKCYQNAIKVSKDPIYNHWAGVFLGFAYLANGQLEEAEAPLLEVVSYSQKFGYGILGTIASASYGIVLIEKGQMSKGLKMIEEARQSSLKNERTWVFAFVEYLLGSVYAEMAKGEKSASLLTMAKNLGFLIKNLPTAGKKAEEHFNKAIEVGEKIGANGMLGPTYLDLGIFYKAKGRTKQAKECINRAIEIFHQNEAYLYLKKANEALESIK